MFRRSRRTTPASDNPPDNAPDAAADHPIRFSRLLSYTRPYLGLLALALVMTVISGALSLVFPAVIRDVVDSVLEDRNETLLNNITVLLLAVFLVRSVTSLIEVYTLNYVGERITMDLRVELYNHLQQLSLRFYDARRVGELISRLSSDVTVVRGALTNSLTTLLQQLVIAVGAVAIMLWLNWRLSLFILGLLPVIMVLAVVFGVWLRRISTEVQDELAGATTVADEVLQNVRVVKSFAREPFERERYLGANQRTLAAALRLLRIRSVFGPLMGFLGFGAVALVLWYGGQEVLEDRLTGGELIAFLVYGISVAGALGALVGLYTTFQEALGATRRVFQLLDTVPDVTDAPDAQTLPRVQGRITLEDVSFAYEEAHAVLHNITLNIAPGEILALVGPSGAGKSTLFNLIPRFYDPTSGSIRVDGIDVRAVTQASLRDNIAVVPQETLLFGGTVYENIAYGRLNADEQAIINAATAANAHEFILALPNGYQTIVGERGIRLSGGQRQRIAIARAVLKDAPILLLDEATSALDSESEAAVQDAFARLMRGRTTIIIAHRLSTVRGAHRVAVLEHGHLVELGTHDELLAQGGTFARLYALQFDQQHTNGRPAPTPTASKGSLPA